MKILMVTRETQADKRYGLGRSLTPLIDEFRNRGILIDYLCQADLGARSLLWQHWLHRLLSWASSGFHSDTDFPTLFHVLLERLNMGRLAAKVAAKFHYSHVHCHDPIIAGGFSFFSLFYPGHKIKWGVTEHGFGCYTQAIFDDGVRMGSRIMKLMRYSEARTLLAASWVITPTQRAMKQLGLELGIAHPPPTWQAIYHARPKLNIYSKTEARKLLGWEKDIFYIIAIGRIAPVKQFSLLVTSCAQLNKQTDFQLFILGEGDHKTLLDLGKQQGLERDILFATTNDVGLYLSAADLYVSTSRSESFGLANLEAMTAGIAVICTSVGGVPEVVGDSAILVSQDSESITTAIQDIYDNSDLRKTMAEKATARALTWPDINEIADRYESCY